MYRVFKGAFLEATRVNRTGAITVRTTPKRTCSKLFVLSSLSLSLLFISKLTRKQSQYSYQSYCLGDEKALQVEGEDKGVVHYQINKPLGDDQFEEYLESVHSAHPGSPIFVLFMGNICPKKGQHWCRDCLVAEPIIAHEVSRCGATKHTSTSSSFTIPPLVLVTCAVCRDFMLPTFPYRINPSIRLASVPCLVRWNFDKDAASPSTLRLNDYECKNRLWVRNFLESYS